MGTYYDKIGTWNDTYCIKMFKTSSFPLARCIMGDAEWVLFPNELSSGNASITCAMVPRNRMATTTRELVNDTRLNNQTLDSFWIENIWMAFHKNTRVITGWYAGYSVVAFPKVEIDGSIVNQSV